MFTSSPVVSRPQQSSYSSGSGSGSKSQAEPTIFSEKASPREVHERPEVQRGMPPAQAHRLSKVDGRNVNNDVGGGSRVRAQMREKGTEEAFRGPSRPRLIYERPGDRELPRIGVLLALGVLGLGWGLFLLHATNQERLSSSVLRQVTFQLRNSKEVIAVLGEHIKLQENWWALGQPWISGTINLMQGRVDLSFRIKGDKGSGTVYFTSIRPQEKGAWRIVRYKIIADDGEVVRLEDQEVIKAKH
ncbi:hypothetical protein I317_07133 [Kwoniella heveanensis CBS 569]|uniref:DUF1783-domain-containing protein n=1 Tax=Kwoniella heveanensis BCC8398 TaxID=1296120 RepID=A0A1B9GMS9_9TREE|nr:hypothetical protein I316_05951 [Kwoniella heveanensis BCC8398]OCF39063.1 hypothetical protein I317_07133 [Kwoniella heveanensis CBS 569]